MEQIKEAFYKVKQDIEYLKKEIFILNKNLIETRESLVEICEVLKDLSIKKEGVERESIKEGKEEILDLSDYKILGDGEIKSKIIIKALAVSNSSACSPDHSCHFTSAGIGKFFFCPINTMLAQAHLSASANNWATNSGPMPAGSPVKTAMRGTDI